MDTGQKRLEVVILSERVEHILRGYDNFYQKLLTLGAEIRVIEDEEDEASYRVKCV